MKTRTHASAKGSRTPVVAIGIGAGLAILISFLLTAGVTSLVMRGTIKEENSHFIIFMIRAISVLSGALLTTGLHKNNTLPLIGAICLTYFIALTAIAIIAYDGIFRNMGGAILSVLTGGVCTVLIRLTPAKRNKYNRHYTK